jgi:phosphatidylserine decarboxylase
MFGIVNNTVNLNSNNYKNCKIVVARLAPQDYHRVHYPITGKIIYIDQIKGHYRSVQPVVVNNKDVYDINRRTNIWAWNDNIGLYVICLIGATCVGSIGLLQKKNNQIEINKLINPKEYINNVLMNDDNYDIIVKDDINNLDINEDDGKYINGNKNESTMYFNKKTIKNNVKIESLINQNVELLQQINVYQFGGSTAILILPDLNNKIKFCERILDLSKTQKISTETLVFPGQYIGSF